MRYRRWEDRLACLYGKLLLKEGLRILGLPNDLCSWGYSEFNKPFLDGASFNITHSGGLVACAIDSSNHSIGVDVEAIRFIESEPYNSIWTDSELVLLRKGGINTFPWLWTRKEAIVKAKGCGINDDLSAIDVVSDSVILDDVNYFIYEVFVKDKFQLHLALSRSSDVINVVDLSHVFVPTVVKGD